MALQGKIIVTTSVVNRESVTYDLNGTPRGALAVALAAQFEAASGSKVILQYQPGADGNEAGSRWFDFAGGTTAANAQKAVAIVFDWLDEVEESFDSGVSFLA